MIKKYLGIDFIDLLIQLGITFGVAVALSAVARPDDEIAVSLVMVTSLVVLGLRRARAMKRQDQGAMTTGEAQLDRLNYLEERMVELEQAQGRMLELEERLDFTERLLAQQRDPARIGPAQ